MSDLSAIVLTEVGMERLRQDAKWGEQNHQPSVWLAILSEEVGELATAMLRDRFGTGAEETREAGDMRREAIQVAAVAVAFVEYLDRQLG